MDVADIAPGVDFAEAVENTIRSCKVLVVVIGPRWLELLHAREGGRDYVEHEIEAALRLGLTVIPALAGGAQARGSALLARESPGWPVVVWRKLP